MRNLLRHRVFTLSAVILAVMAVLSFAAPWIAPHAPDVQSLKEQYRSPCREHPFGTDMKGRDLFSRVLHGGGISFGIGILATAVSLLIGVTYGSIAGYFGGKLDEFMMRLVDVIYGLPYIVFVIVLVVVLGHRTWEVPLLRVKIPLNLIIALGAVQWLTMARIVRGQVLSLKKREFIEAARALGAGPARIILRHIIPNILGPVTVYATLTVPQVIRQEAFLSFLGLGVQPPGASWGVLAAEGLRAVNPVRIYWWLVVFPGIALFVTLFALNFLGDALRDVLDPRTAGRRRRGSGATTLETRAR
jgi:oligopeptide transport system permease protein